MRRLPTPFRAWTSNMSPYIYSLITRVYLMCLKQILRAHKNVRPNAPLKPRPATFAAAVRQIHAAQISVSWEFIKGSEVDPSRRVENVLRSFLRKGLIVAPLLVRNLPPALNYHPSILINICQERSSSRSSLLSTLSNITAPMTAVIPGEAQPNEEAVADSDVVMPDTVRPDSELTEKRT